MNKNWVVLIVLLAVGARAGLLMTVPDRATRLRWSGQQTPDSADYLELASDLRAGGQFGPRDGAPEIFRTPGYPAFLAAVDSSFLRIRPESRSFPIYVVVSVQIAIDAATICLTCWLGALVVGPRAGLLAGFLQAISPLAIGASCRILSDSLYAFAFTTAVLLMIGHLRSGKWWLLVAAAVALGASCYARPVAQFMAPVFALALLFRRVPWFAASSAATTGLSPGVRDVVAANNAANHGTQRESRHPTPNGVHGRLAKAIAFLLLSAACIAPWIYRNGVRADYWGFSSVFGDTLYHFAAPEVLARAENMTADAARDGIASPPYSLCDPSKVWGTFDDPNEIGAEARWRRTKAMEVVAGHPWTYAKLHAAGCVAFWLPSTDALEIAGLTKGGRGTLGVLKENGFWAAAKNYFGDNTVAMILAVPIALFALLQCAGALMGLVLGAGNARRQNIKIPSSACLLVLIVAVSCLVSGTTGTPRFRIPVEPILNIAAAAGLVSLLAGRKKQRAKIAPSN